MVNENRNFKIVEGDTKYAICEGDRVKATVDGGIVSFDIIDIPTTTYVDRLGVTTFTSPAKTRHVGQTPFEIGDTFASAWRRVW
jgi:hypothetical protein